jgi:hypothetical protein
MSSDPLLPFISLMLSQKKTLGPKKRVTQELKEAKRKIIAECSR